MKPDPFDMVRQAAAAMQTHNELLATKATIAALRKELAEAQENYHLVNEAAAKLRAEVERLTERNKFLEQIDSYLKNANEHSFEQRCNELEAEVERLKSFIEDQQSELSALREDAEQEIGRQVEDRQYWERKANEGEPSV